MPSRFCPRKPSRKSSSTREINVELARGCAPQNEEQERHKNQALSRPTPRQCSLPALRIWQQKQMDPEQRQIWFDSVLAEVAAKPSVKSRGKTNPRGIKRKMSSFPVRSRDAPLNRPAPRDIHVCGFN